MTLFHHFGKAGRGQVTFRHRSFSSIESRLHRFFKNYMI